MITSIDGYVFAACQGTVQLKRKSTSRFASSASADPGVQITPPMSVPFELRLTKYVSPGAAQINVDAQLAKIGQLVLLRNNGIEYYLAPHSVRFLVMNVSIDDSRAIVHASGYTGATYYNLSPAWRIVSRWTLQAVDM